MSELSLAVEASLSNVSFDRKSYRVTCLVLFETSRSVLHLSLLSLISDQQHPSRTLPRECPLCSKAVGKIPFRALMFLRSFRTRFAIIASCEFGKQAVVQTDPKRIGRSKDLDGLSGECAILRNARPHVRSAGRTINVSIMSNTR